MKPSRATERAHARRIENRGPGEIPDGYALCDCGKIGKVTKRGRISAHKTPRGDECSGAVGIVPVELEELPAVVAPRAGGKRFETDREAANRTAERGVCRECGKQLYGDRTLCGACAVRLGR